MNLIKGLRRVTGIIILAAGGLLSGCEGGTVIVPYTDEPMLYLVLGPESSFTRRNDTEGLFALLLTTGTPIEAEYLAADRFEMWRTSDGARFAWRHLGLSGKAPQGEDQTRPNLWNGNYFLPDSGSIDGLGALDLRPGESYELRLEAAGRTIRGSVMIPQQFSVSIVEQDGKRMMVWPSVEGATAYSVYSGYDAARIQADTFYVLAETDPRRGAPDGHHVIVRALDPNLYRYMTESTTGRAGIDEGYGVFGAVVKYEERRTEASAASSSY